MSPHNLPVVIVGAGVGGLTLALLLRRRGIAFEILERSAELREAGAAVALAANGTRVLRALGLGEPLARVSTEPSRMVHRDGRDGRLIAASPGNEWYRGRFGAPLVGLHRMALQRLLADALGPGHLHLGAQADRLERRSRGMRVHCSSGAAFDARVVVGADGVHSRMRTWVTGGDEPVYSGASGFRGLVPAGQVPHLPEPGALQFWMGPGAHLLHFSIDGGALINFLAVVDTPARWTAPGWTAPAPDGALLEAFAGWHPAVTEMLAAVPQSPRWGLFARRPLARWSRGPVVLLGDAAHAMLPHHGQGANQAIEDAAVLAAELSRAGEAGEALRRYELRRRVRTRQVQLASWATSAALHLPEGPRARRRDVELARLPEWLTWIHGYDALAEAAGTRAGLRQIGAVNESSFFSRDTMSSWTASSGRSPSTVNSHSRLA
jgi:salicylate hydroxylase